MLSANLRRTIQSFSTWVLITSLVVFYPASAVAMRDNRKAQASPTVSPALSVAPTNSPGPSPEPSPVASPAATPAPTKNQAGPRKPTGEAGSSYTFNKVTGLWENDHYIWNPETGQSQPKQTPTYSYNPTTGMWDTTEWRYDAAQHEYMPNVVSTSQPPAGAQITDPQGDSTHSPGDRLTALTAAGENQPHSAKELASILASPLTGSTLKKTNSTTGLFDLFYNATISNTLDSLAQTGNAEVTKNSTGGDATTGDAQAIANIMNMMNSGINLLSGGNIVTFMRDIVGDVTGDLFLDPGQLPSSQQDTSNTSLTVNQQATGTINNDINLGAQSGNASVNKNTSAGSATSGDADVVANVVNMINSAIASNQSFLGVLNIRGNLNGDILMPPEALNKLLGSNAPSALVSNQSVTNQSLLAEINNQTSINNDVSLSALTGDAKVAGNTSAGSASSGNANTKLNVLNLTGSDTIGDNALLVFVNVLGKWTGLIVNAPAGSTAAALCSSTCQSTSQTDISGTVTSNNTNTINNKVVAGAKSGDSSVTKNTSAGSATTGDASASANIANLFNSKFDISKWFGVLFINVFGEWNGSFGIDTAAGNKPIGSGGSADPAAAAVKFVPRDAVRVSSLAAKSGAASNDMSATPPQTVSTDTQKNNDVRGAATLASRINTPPSSTVRNTPLSKYFFPSVMGSFAVGLFGLELLLRKRRDGYVWKVPERLAKRRVVLDSLSPKPRRRRLV